MKHRKATYKQDRANQAGLLVAAATIPNTFQETLMPRDTTDQGIVTGVNMAVNYEIANTITKLIEDVAEQLSGTVGARKDNYKAHVRQRRFSIALNLLALGAAQATERALKQKADETTTRGIARTGAGWVSRTAIASIMVSTLQSLFETNNKKTKHREVSRVPVGLIGGVVAAIFTEHQRQSAIKQSNGQKLHDDHINTLKALGMGLGILGTLGAVGYGQRAFADLIADEMEKVLPNTEDFWWTAGHLTAIAGTGLGVMMFMRRVYRHIEEVATKIEPAYLQKPDSSFVSGSKTSLVSWRTLSVQGRRYVSGATTAADIKQVMGTRTAQEPIRVFVGLDSAPSEQARVDKAIEELERTGAFQRQTIMLISPTGTGYVNYVAVESAEYMSHGNIASVALQYSKRPSPMSLDRVPEGRGQFKMLLKAITRRLEKIPKTKRPQLVIFGESLGAWTSQDSFIDQGTDGLRYAGIDKALWIGSPYGSKWKTQVLYHQNRPDVEPELVGNFNSIADVELMPATARKKLRYVMITHDNDAVALFGASLLYQKPDWLTDPAKRSQTVSKQQYYTSPGTFMLTLMDMKNSMHVIPGQFEANGHDYRADLAEFVSFTYGFTTTAKQMQSVEKALRRNELERAQKLNPKK